MKRIFATIVIGLGLSGLAANAATTKTEPPVSAQFSGNHLSLSAKKPMRNVQVTVTGPGGYVMKKSQRDGLPSMFLDNKMAMPDGDYYYEVSGTTGPERLIKDTIDNGRGENNFTYAGTPVKFTGHFKVRNGQVRQFRQVKEPSFRTR